MRPLQGEVREYAWGDLYFLPELLGQPDRQGRPNAELWMGAHPAGPSTVDGTGLDELITSDPERWLGPRIAGQFGQLPFLFKVLAIRSALSIQAHPSLAQAEAGYDREDAAGVSLTGFDRSYRDRNHKPELICALTDFEALCGFRTAEDASSFLEELGCPGLTPVRELLGGPDRLEGAMRYLLGLSPGEASQLATAVGAALTADLGPERAAVMRSLRAVSLEWPGDIGLVVALLLNHVALRPGEALFLGPGNLHAYLVGAGVEVMANSDNVVRGGLTPKHVDSAELLAILDYSEGQPDVQRPVGPQHTFESPVPEFALTRVDLSAGATPEITGPAIILLTDGHLSPQGSSGTLEVAKGQPLFVAFDDPPVTLSGQGLAWVATVNRESSNG